MNVVEEAINRARYRYESIGKSFDNLTEAEKDKLTQQALKEIAAEKDQRSD